MTNKQLAVLKAWAELTIPRPPSMSMVAAKLAKATGEPEVGRTGVLHHVRALVTKGYMESDGESSYRLTELGMKQLR